MKPRSSSPTATRTRRPRSLEVATAAALAPPPADSFAAHFDQIRAECAAFDPAHLVQLSLDVPAAVATALGALPRIRTYRDAIATHLPHFDLTQFDRLETYARAAQYANSANFSGSAPDGESLPELARKGIELRTTLIAGLQALVSKKVLPADRGTELRSGIAYRDIAADLVALAAKFTGVWARVSTRTAVDHADLVEAESLASRILVAVGTREQTATTPTQASIDRHRAVSLFVRCYDQIRRALTFLRWEEDDVDRIAPGLYKRDRAARRKDASDTPAAAPAAPATPVAPVAPATPVAPVAPATPVVPAAPVSVANHGTPSDRPVGQGDPFNRG